MTDPESNISDAPGTSSPAPNPTTTPDPAPGSEKKVQSPCLPEEPQQIIETLILDVTHAERKLLECRLNAAARYAWARRNLPHAEWRRLFREKRLRIGIRQAQMLCRVGDNVGLCWNTANYPHLPNSIVALCELSSLRPDTISRHCQDHLITPKTTARQAKALVKKALADEALGSIQPNPPRIL